MIYLSLSYQERASERSVKRRSPYALRRVRLGQIAVTLVRYEWSAKGLRIEQQVQANRLVQSILTKAK